MYLSYQKQKTGTADKSEQSKTQQCLQGAGWVLLAVPLFCACFARYKDNWLVTAQVVKRWILSFVVVTTALHHLLEGSGCIG